MAHKALADSSERAQEREILAHKALGLLQVAHSSERVRERDEQCAQVARIYTGAPVYA